MSESLTVAPAPRSAAHSRLTRLNNWLLRAITGGALIFALLALISLIVRSAHLLTASVLEIGPLNLANGNTPAFAAKSDAIVSAHYDTATLMVDGLPSSVRWLYVSQLATDSLLSIGLCVIVFLLGMKLIAERPFGRSAANAIATAAGLVMAVGVFSPFLTSLANAETVSFLGEGVLSKDTEGSATEGLWLLIMNLDFAPLAWGFALALIASAFAIGERLQRDNEGLV